MVKERDSDIDIRTGMLPDLNARFSLMYGHRTMLAKPPYYIDSRYDRSDRCVSAPLLMVYITRLAKSSPRYQLSDSMSNQSLTKTSISTFGCVRSKTSLGHRFAKTGCRIWEAKRQ